MAPTLPLTIDPSQILPDGHISPFSALAFVWLMLVVYALVFTVAMIAAVRWWRRSRIANASYRADAPLEPGEVVVQGWVEHAAHEEIAVRVEVDQEGSEHESSGSWSTSWTERNRRVKVRPFYLRLTSGQRIRVEPTVEVQLVDAMDGAIRVNLAKRVRVAELTPGEGIFAHGSLQVDRDPEAEGGYRGGQHGLVLRPLRGGHMLLSSEPLGLRYRRRFVLHRFFGLGVLFLAVLVNLALLGYYSSLFKGQPRRAVITQLKHLVKSDSDGDTHYYRVWMRLEEPRPIVFDDDVDEDIFRHLKAGMELPVRLTTGGVWPSLRVGSGATYHGGLVFLLLFPLGVLGMIYGFTAARPLAWYEGDLTESESGRLAESEPRPPEASSEAGEGSAAGDGEGERGADGARDDEAAGA